MEGSPEATLPPASHTHLCCSHPSGGHPQRGRPCFTRRLSCSFGYQKPHQRALSFTGLINTLSFSTSHTLVHKRACTGRPFSLSNDRRDEEKKPVLDVSGGGSTHGDVSRTHTHTRLPRLHVFRCRNGLKKEERAETGKQGTSVLQEATLYLNVCCTMGRMVYKTKQHLPGQDSGSKPGPLIQLVWDLMAKVSTRFYVFCQGRNLATTLRRLSSTVASKSSG